MDSALRVRVACPARRSMFGGLVGRRRGERASTRSPLRGQGNHRSPLRWYGFGIIIGIVRFFHPVKIHAHSNQLNALPNLSFLSLYLIYKVHSVTHSTMVFKYPASCDADCQNNTVFILFIICLIVPIGKSLTKCSPSFGVFGV